MISIDKYSFDHLNRMILNLRRTRDHPYPNILIKSHRAIYFYIPKVASTSIKATLAPYAGVEIKKNRIHRARYPRVSSKEIFSIDTSAYFKFAFVRNPVDRLISCHSSLIESGDYNDQWLKNGVARGFLHYRWQKGTGENVGKMFWGGMSFSEFARSVCAISDRDSDKHFRSQYTFITDAQNRIFVDFIGKFENLNNDFQKICEKLNFPNTTLSHRQQSNRRLELDEINEPLWEMITERYQRDFELFDYNSDFRARSA